MAFVWFLFITISASITIGSIPLFLKKFINWRRFDEFMTIFFFFLIFLSSLQTFVRRIGKNILEVFERKTPLLVNNGTRSGASKSGATARSIPDSFARRSS